MRTKASIAAVVFGLLAFSGTANATILKWTIESGAFDGLFIYNDKNPGKGYYDVYIQGGVFDGWRLRVD